MLTPANLLLLLCGLLVLTTPSFAQEAEADSLVTEAINLMDQGEYAASIEKLEAAKKLFPGKSLYDYEIGLAHYKSGDYQAAKKVYEKLVKKYGDDPLQYKMLGNTYDVLGEPEKAIETYEKGLETYPDSGPIYLELGIVYAGQNDYSKAVDAWETGIRRDPGHASNYFYAAQIFAQTKEKIWGILYGELFLNLEFNTTRTQKISSLLYDLYNNLYEAETDTSGQFNLTEVGFTIVMDDDLLKKMESGEQNLKLLPFEGEFAMKYALTSTIYQLEVQPSIARLTKIRAAFLDIWFDAEDDSSVHYDHALLSYLKSVQEQGFLDCYDMLLFQHGSPGEIGQFYEAHAERFEAFLQWYQAHDLELEGRGFMRLDYR